MVARAGCYICSVRINNTTNQPQKHISNVSHYNSSPLFGHHYRRYRNNGIRGPKKFIMIADGLCGK